MEGGSFSLKAGPGAEGHRIDSYISDLEPEALGGRELSRSAVQKLISEGKVLVGGVPARKNRILRNGEEISIEIPEAKPLAAEPEDIPIDIVYEDDDVIVVNKPQGMVVHPAPGNETGTLVNGILFHCGGLSGINGVARPGIVHRIDKDTSGLLVVAKNDAAHRCLAGQFAEHSITRRYHCVVRGVIKEDSGTVDAPIGRDPRDRKKFCVTEKNSKRAVTTWEVIDRYRDYTYISLRLLTGRTHQIRVHMAYIGHPVAGDPVYGRGAADKGLAGQCLHAKILGFRHPGTGEYMEFDSLLPDYFTGFLSGLGPGGQEP
ncbi:MAG: RluA family pseudouridine synthase [Oscillospiraceae bacterium]|jgi:23S rRNA pseudouridine1911/1915/1917 synthase